MKKLSFAIITLLAVGMISYSCSDSMKSSKAAESPEESAVNLVERGEYLVTVIGCNDCHSPKRMGPRGPEIIPELMLSGFQAGSPVLELQAETVKSGGGQFNADLTSFGGPWGISFAANLTSDPTGIGNWTEDQFRIAMTQGKYKGLENSRMLLPPMPWFNWINISDQDLKAIFAYLKSTPPVSNVVPPPVAPPAIN